jgi:peroxiredoxin
MPGIRDTGPAAPPKTKQSLLRDAPVRIGVADRRKVFDVVSEPVSARRMSTKMKPLVFAVLVGLCLVINGATAEARGEQIQKAETAVPATEQITPINSWAHYREMLRSRGMSDAEVDASIERDLASLRAMNRAAGDDRIGIAAPPFQFEGWLNSAPLTVEDLRGRVVLVRWWTDTCPFCASSAPALRALHEDYSGNGFMVIGVFHPKDGRDDPLDVARVQRAIDTRRFTFPVAIDWQWRTRTLKEWWLTGPKRPATSVTFLLDRAGTIRFVHPGMEYHDADGTEGHAMCVDDMASIRAAIERLIAE